MDEKVKVIYTKWKANLGCWHTLSSIRSYNKRYIINTYEIWCQGKVAKYEKVTW